MATNTLGTPARDYGRQLVHYARVEVNWNDTGISSGVGKMYLPAGAIIVGTDVYGEAAFNAGTTNVVTCGTNASAYDNIVAAGDFAESTGLTKDVSPTGTALGPLTADAQVFVKYAQTGTAATAGKCHVIIKFVLDNDM